MDILSILKKFFNVPNVGDTPENKGECVGLVESYADTLKLPHVWGNAKDLLTNADASAFAITYNNPNDLNQFPVSGSIMVWGETWGNGLGHTGVVIFADGRLFATLEQNNPIGHAPQTIMHDYKGVIGWMTPKNLPVTPTFEQLDACMKDRQDFWAQRDAALKHVEEATKQCEEVTAKLTAFAALGYATVEDVTKKVDDLTKTNQGLQTELQQVLDRNKKLAQIVFEKENEDATAIDKGLEAQRQLEKMQFDMQTIAKMANTKPEINAILDKFDYVKRVANWAEGLRKKSEQVQVETPKDTVATQNGFSTLLSWLGLDKKGGA